MKEASSSSSHSQISFNNNTEEITLQDHHDGDQDKKEMVKLEVDGGGVDMSLVEARISNGVYDKPLSCFGCGIGWFSFLLGFAFPPLWYFATVLYFGSFLKDPRERPGLAASAIAALICSVITLIMSITVIVVYWKPFVD